MRQGIARLSTLLLLPFTALAPQGASAAVQPSPQIVGDSLSCPRVSSGEVQVCGRAMTIADIAYLHGYAGCLVRRHHVAAAEAVRAYVSTRDREPLRALVANDRWCKPAGATRVSAVLLAGALAERLPGWQRRLSKGFGEVATAGDLAHCLIAADPRATLSLLRATPLSPKEQEAAARLAALLPTCVPAGMRFETHRPALRSVLALALFDPSAPLRDDTLGDARPVAAAASGQVTTSVSAALVPVVTLNKPREQLAIIPRITAHHVSPDIRHELFEEDHDGTDVGGWPVDPDTGDAPDPTTDKSLPNPNPEG